MIAVFNIGAMYPDGPDAVRIEVLQIDVQQLRLGSAGMIRELVSACGLAAPVRDWTIRPMRSFFFSSYPDSETWEDRWRKGWTVRVVFAADVAASPVVFTPARGVDISDPSWEYGQQPDEGDRDKVTLVTQAAKVGAPDESQATAELTALLEEAAAELEVTQIFTFKERQFASVLFKHFEPEKAAAAIRRLDQLGFITHWWKLL